MVDTEQSREETLTQLIRDDTRMMRILIRARSLDLPQWCICAGFVRAKVWDWLHGFAPTDWPDVDVVYYDSEDTDERTEKRHEQTLRALEPSVPWSVKNQARMHVKNAHAPYQSTKDGLANFPEVCTAVGVYLDDSGHVKFIAPYGLGDLFELMVRPTPFFQSGEQRIVFEQRVREKRWIEKWPRIQVLYT